MWIIINIIQFLLIAIWTAVCVIIDAFLPLKWQYWVCNNIWAPGTLFLVGGRLRVIEKENLLKSKQYLIIGNHTSWGDIIVLFIATKQMLRFIAKAELAKLPFIGFMMKRMGMVFVERGNSQKSAKSVKQTIAKIKGGARIVGFPEGTRSKTGKLGPFKKGLIMIAAKAEIDIIPVGLSNVQKVWPLNNFRFRPGKIHVRFGEPISTVGYDEKNISELVEKVRTKVGELVEY